MRVELQFKTYSGRGATQVMLHIFNSYLSLESELSKLISINLCDGYIFLLIKNTYLISSLKMEEKVGTEISFVKLLFVVCCLE